MFKRQGIADNGWCRHLLRLILMGVIVGVVGHNHPSELTKRLWIKLGKATVVVRRLPLMGCIRGIGNDSGTATWKGGTRNIRRRIEDHGFPVTNAHILSSAEWQWTINSMVVTECNLLWRRKNNFAFFIFAIGNACGYFEVT